MDVPDVEVTFDGGLLFFLFLLAEVFFLLINLHEISNAAFLFQLRRTQVLFLGLCFQFSELSTKQREGAVEGMSLVGFFALIFVLFLLFGF